ncbi:hypothetical protein JCM17380_44650 [Desulfosporosinus burensis]
MKIDDMLVREDFYNICERTLSDYFTNIYMCPSVVNVVKKNQKCDLYIFPRLNAIISLHVNRSVVSFLEDEYRVRGSILRRLIVKTYIWSAIRFKWMFAVKGICITGLQHDLSEMLIYPCNRKIRVFHFEKGIVDVILKEGFADATLRNEISARTILSKTFIPKIEEVFVNGYREKIIDGIPLARISDNIKYETYRAEAYQCVHEIGLANKRLVSLQEYVNQLVSEIASKSVNKLWAELSTSIQDMLQDDTSEIPLGPSHGDLHHGNIWVERNTKSVIIIDWETYNERSLWYDAAVLFCGLRNVQGIQQLPEQIEKMIATGEVQFYNSQLNSMGVIISVLLLEDMLFKLLEHSALPCELDNTEADVYIKDIELCIGKLKEKYWIV